MDENMIPKAEHDTAVAKARDEGKASGVTAERSRIGAILALDEAKGREASAQHLALNTDLTADAAKGVLAGLQPAAAVPDAPAAPEAPVLQRSADAPGGLVTSEPSRPAPTSAEKTQSMWKDTIAAINGRNSAAH